MWLAYVFSLGTTLVDVLQNWLNWIHILFLEVGLLVILIDHMIFLSPFLDVCVNSFFPRTPRLWDSLPLECIPLTYDFSGFKSRINRQFNWTFFLNRFPICYNLVVLLFLVTPCLLVAVQPCMEWIIIKKKQPLTDFSGQSLLRKWIEYIVLSPVNRGGSRTASTSKMELFVIDNS